MKYFYLSRSKSNKSDFIISCVKYLAQEMKINNHKKNLVLVTFKESGIDEKKCFGATSMIGDNIYVYINTRLGLVNLLTVIAHEMVHVSQFARGHLRKEFHGEQPINFWCNTQIDDSVSYENLPWEVKAYKKQFDLSLKLVGLLT